MNRLHPQDLRAIMAAIIYAGDRDYHMKGAIQHTALFMAELERTAKPDPGFHTGRETYTIPSACPKVDETTETPKFTADPDARFQEGRAQGVMEERERIICELNHNENLLLCRFDPKTGDHTQGMDEWEVREALEPKP